MKIGERIVEGEVREKEQAKKTYAEAKTEGRRAALLEQERPNIFTSSVANIAPGEEIRVEIEYQQTLRYDQGRYSLRFPMVVGPRYLPAGDGPGGRGAHQPRGAAARTSRRRSTTRSRFVSRCRPACRSTGCGAPRTPSTPAPAVGRACRSRAARAGAGQQGLRARLGACARRRAGRGGDHREEGRPPLRAAHGRAAGARRPRPGHPARGDLRHRHLGLDAGRIDRPGARGARARHRPALRRPIAST